MKIKIVNTIENTTGTNVYPVSSSSKHYESALNELEALTGIDIEWLRQDFKGELNEVHLVYGKGKKWFLLGLGENPGVADCIKAFKGFSFKLRKKLPSKTSIVLPGNLPLDPAILAEPAINGLILGAYQVGMYKTQDIENHPFKDTGAELWLVAPKGKNQQIQQAAKRGMDLADTQTGIFNLVNAPGNKKRPADLAEWATRSGEQYGYKVEVFNKNQIEKKGLHALLSVSYGSEIPPVFIVMEYKPAAKGLKKVGLVGKGVTFDTGGLSLKPSANMHLMKSDMGGAAAVLGTMEMAAKLSLPVHLIGIIPSTENCIDGKSMKPGDVINSYSGKTIEVTDTDAEGRLILADGISYMVKNYQPEVIIDLATLTGSAVRTFGYHTSGLFSNNDQLADLILSAGEKTGERAWRLPLWDIYKEDIKSDIADVRNFSGKPTAGTISAAKFLEAFLLGHTSWAHLDIAGVAFQESDMAPQRAATGYGIRLLLEFIRLYALEHPTNSNNITLPAKKQMTKTKQPTK